MKDEEIELLDIDDGIEEKEIKSVDKVEFKEIEKQTITEEDKGKRNKNKKKKLKKGLLQTLFCLVSITFIIGCCIYYGNRLIKYYKIYNPKTTNGESVKLIAQTIIENSPIVFEGSGVYRENGLYVYKGEDANNYIRFSNMLWRIIRTNSDGSIEVILDDSINALVWDANGNSYIDSDIHKYINDVFLDKIDKTYLSKTSICTDPMEDITSFTCNNKELDSYVKLIPANDFLNTVADGSTYVAGEGEYVWIGTTYNKEKVWHTNGSNISSSDNTSTYLVKPVVTIKNSTQVLGGTGSIDDPYIIEKSSNNPSVGSYIKIDEDIWIVYEVSGKTLKLVSSGLYKDGLFTYRFAVDSALYDITSDNSLAKLLNEDFYESLSYKDILVEFDMYTGTYTGVYKDVYKDSVKVKVGIPSIVDFKFDSEVDGYYLSNGYSENRIYYYKNDLVISKPGLSRVIRPTIAINNPNITNGSGKLDDPYIVEVEYE